MIDRRMQLEKREKIDCEKRIADLQTKVAKLEFRIARAKPLIGHKSLSSRRQLLAILEGHDE